MATYGTNDWKPGLKVMHDGYPCTIIENEMVKPGKGQAFNRVKLRNLKTGRVLEKTFKANDSLEGADVVDTDMQYLYSDGEVWNFMHPETFDQISVPKDVLGDQGQWLVEGMTCSVQSFEGNPIAIELPQRVTFEIVEADPVVKGQTASSSFKPAKLSNGARVMVPPHIGAGTRVVVMTADGSYVERAKD